MEAVRLHPAPRIEVPAVQIYEDLELPREHENDYRRPYVVVNAISTLDGKLSRKGVSSGIGSCVDRRAMRVIRSRADAVLVGAGTARAEKVSLSVPEDLAHWREARGESSQPLGIVLSRSGDIQRERLTQISPNLLILTEADLPAGERIPEAPAIGEYLRFLRSRHNVRHLLVEGGPTVNYTLFEKNLVDELFLTLSPKLYGGQENTLLNGALLPNPAPELKLISAFLCEHELFLRYSLKACL